jgi:hypothetical protein
MQQLQRPAFPPWGYIVVSANLTTLTQQRLLQAARRANYNPVFREVGGAHDDPFRRQPRVTRMTATLNQVAANIGDLARVHDAAYVPTVFSFMQSLPGGLSQQPHQDYSDEDRDTVRRRYPESVPASAILALEPGTRLIVYDGCFDVARHRRLREDDIPPGFVILFRGDLFHAGSGYSDFNYRLHCYLHFANVEWVPDMVTAVSVVYTCQYCGHSDTGSAAIRRHRFLCESNPLSVQNRQRRRARENRRGAFSCVICGETFQVASTCRAHVASHRF